MFLKYNCNISSIYNINLELNDIYIYINISKVIKVLQIKDLKTPSVGIIDPETGACDLIK